MEGQNKDIEQQVLDLVLKYMENEENIILAIQVQLCIFQISNLNMKIHKVHKTFHVLFMHEILIKIEDPLSFHGTNYFYTKLRNS